jgi:putative addiction module killer protein
MRINYGPGYRVYHKTVGCDTILLLCGGDKTTQMWDIAEAKRIAARYERED